ncbi:conserved Plasmodium protein, unknown function [Plasmodium malariae]|nr:conserved Plasmodium protein, unknown function [Plasmodium malariae]
MLKRFGNKKKYLLSKSENRFIYVHSTSVVTDTLKGKRDTVRGSETIRDSNTKTRGREKEVGIILHKPWYIVNYCKVNELINILNLYIKLKNDNIELLKNISMNLLMNKEKLRYSDIIILLKKFSIIKCKNYYLFCYFKDVLMDNLHLLTCDNLIDVYFSFTRLNYFHYNFFLLIEKQLFHNFQNLDLKKVVYLIQCFNKKKIISKNYLTILLYSISKNVNNFNTFQLSVIFSFFKNFNINNSLLINSLIHNFNQNVNLTDEPKHVAVFYNFLSYVSKKCKKSYQYYEKERELIGKIKKFKLYYDEDDNMCGDKPSKQQERLEQSSTTSAIAIEKEILRKDGDIEEYNHGERKLKEKEKKKSIECEIIKKKILHFEHKYLVKNDELDELKEQTSSLKENCYNFSLIYSVKNALKNIEMITKKKIKYMPIESLCIISSASSNIDKNKILLEKIAEEVGKQSTKLTPQLVSFLLLSFSKASHKHGSLIYYSLQFFYKYHNFFNFNQVGLLCKGLVNFSIKENEFVSMLNEFILKNRYICTNVCNEGETWNNRKDGGENGYSDKNEYLNYDRNNTTHGEKDIEKLFYEIEKNIHKKVDNVGRRNYEDQFMNLKRVYMEKEVGENNKFYDNDSKKDCNNYDNVMYTKFVNFSFIDYENIKKNNYYANNLYNIKIDTPIYINNIIYILEYYAFNLVSINEILNFFCDIFLKGNLSYILYSRIFYSFYLLQYGEEKVYKLINKFNNYQPLYQVMYKEKHIMRLMQSLIYFYENRKMENGISDIYFFILPKNYFSFIFNFSKYVLTFLFIKNNSYVLHKFLVHIKHMSMWKTDCIFLHKPNNLY